MSRAIAAVAFAGLTLCTAGEATESPERIDSLIHGLASDNAAVRTSARKDLLAIGSSAVVPLVRAGAGRNIALAIPAQNLLPEFGTVGIDAIVLAYGNFAYDAAMVDVAATATARMGPAAIPRMIEMVIRGDSPGYSRGYGVMTLLRMDEAVEMLLPLMRHHDAGVRMSVAAVLAGHADARAYDVLLLGLQDADHGVRLYSAQGLGSLGDARAADVLLEAAQHEPHLGAQLAAAGALGKMWQPRFTPVLARLARSHKEILLRDTAAKMLIGASDDPVAVRLGWRYKPVKVGPMAQRWVNFTYGLALLVTGGLLTLALVVGVRIGSRKGIIGSGAGAAVLGYGWGRLIMQINGQVEMALLVVMVPLWAAFALFVAKVIMGDERGRFARAALAASVAGFYVAYGIGWLRLWGRI